MEAALKAAGEEGENSARGRGGERRPWLRARPHMPGVGGFPSSLRRAPARRPTLNPQPPAPRAGPAVQEAKAAAAALTPPPEVASFQAAKEVFDEVSKHHPVLRGVLETLIQEVRP